MAASWASTYGLEEVYCWADTTDHIFYTFIQHPPIDLHYPNVVIVDIDTMTITYLGVGDHETGQAAVDAILAADHPCATY